LSSSTPTVPVRAPATTARESPSAATGQGPSPLELHDAEPGVEIEAHHARADGAAVAGLRLDLDRVEQEVAHRDRVAARIEDHRAAEATAAQTRR
jgi:hypothetical protein